MRFHSVKELQRRGLDKETAVKLRDLVKGETDPEDYESVQDWLRQGYGRPSADELIMHAANELLEHHGTEAFRLETDSYTGPPALVYTNSGDTYAPELTLSHGETYRYECFADAVERFERTDGYDCLRRC